jgi:hypothetical protein
MLLGEKGILSGDDVGNGLAINEATESACDVKGDQGLDGRDKVLLQAFQECYTSETLYRVH